MRVPCSFSLRSRTFELIQMLQADPVYHQYLLLVKVYVSLCQINKSVEVRVVPSDGHPLSSPSMVSRRHYTAFIHGL